MLKARLISAAILVPLVVYGVLFLPTAVFSIIVGLVFLLGAWEWSRLVPLSAPFTRVLFSTLVVLFMWVLWRLGLQQFIDQILLVAFAWWIWVLFWLSRPSILAADGWINRLFKTAAGVLLMVTAWAALTVLHGSGKGGPWLVLMMLVMVWLADSGAYFAGRLWGKHKLAPLVSPGKTWEGVYGGVAFSLVFAAIAGWFYSGSLNWCLAFVMVALLVVLFSVVGDLLESLMKRQSGVKDSGAIIPGHGGILDRIDSLLAAAPFFLLGLNWFGLDI